MLGRALKMAFWVTYDHIGKLILANMIASAMVLPPLVMTIGALASGAPEVWLLVGFPAATVTMAIAIPAAMAGLAHFAKELIDTRDGSVTSMFTGIRLYGLRAIGLGFVGWVVLLCLGSSIWFYSVRAVAFSPWLGYLLSAVAAWTLIFVALTAMFVIPALVQKKQGVRATATLAALLVVDNPLYSIGLLLQVGALSAMVLLPPVAILLYLATMAVMLTASYEQLARKYALKAYAETGVKDELALRHVAIVSRDGHFVIDDEQDDYLNRGLRDALFPWKE